jgi:hypothetical protein
VRLNDIHEIVENLDIFGKVGRGVAHDEVIPFRVSKRHLFVNNKKSPIVNNQISLTLVKVREAYTCTSLRTCTYIVLVIYILLSTSRVLGCVVIA